MNVTIKDVAKDVGLSWQAVSEILRGKGRYPTPTRERVAQSAARLGYKRHSSALSLRNKSSGLIAVMVRNAPGDELTNMPALETALGVNQEFQDYDVSTLLVRAGELLGSQTQEPRVFRENLVDGVIMIGSFPESLVARVRGLIERVVWVDGPVWQEFGCVRRDEAEAGRLAVRAMATLGYRKVMFIGRGMGKSDHYSHVDRRAGAREAAAKAGVLFEEIAWPEGNVAEQVRVVRERRLLEYGLVVGAAPVARSVTNLLGGLGVWPGWDYGMCCCDESADVRMTWANLSRVKFDRFGMGRMSAALMMKMIVEGVEAAGSLVQGVEWVAGDSAWGPEFVGRLRGE